MGEVLSALSIGNEWRGKDFGMVRDGLLRDGKR